jgi:hypothetical protein
MYVAIEAAGGQVGLGCFVEQVERPGSEWVDNAEPPAVCSKCGKHIPQPAVETPAGWLCATCAVFGLKTIAYNEDLTKWTLARAISVLSPDNCLCWRLTVLLRFEEILQKAKDGNPTTSNCLMSNLVWNLGYIRPHPLARSVRQAALDACVLAGEPILPILKRPCLDEPENLAWQFRANILLVLGRIAPEDGVVRDILDSASKASNRDLRDFAFSAMATHDSPWSRGHIRAGVNDPDPAIRDLVRELIEQFETEKEIP